MMPSYGAKNSRILRLTHQHHVHVMHTRIIQSGHLAMFHNSMYSFRIFSYVSK